MWQCRGQRYQWTFPEGSSSHQRPSCNCSVFWRIFSSSMDPPLSHDYTSGQRETVSLIQICWGMCSKFKRADGAGNAAFPRPNPQIVPCGRDTSRRGGKTCGPSNWRPLFRGTSQTASGCKDFSKDGIDILAP